MGDPMQSQVIQVELDREPFLPIYLNLSDGSEVEVPVPYLTFINRRALFVAHGVRRGSSASDGSGVQLIALADIATIRRSIRLGVELVSDK